MGGVMQNGSTNNLKSGMPIVAKVILILGILIAGLGFVFLLSDIWRELFEKKSFFVSCSAIFYAAGGFLHYKGWKKWLREIFYLLAGGFTIAGFWLFFPNVEYMPQEFKAFYALVFIFALGFLLDSISHYILSVAIFMFSFFYENYIIEHLQFVCYIVGYFIMSVLFFLAFLKRRRISLLLVFLITLFINNLILSPYLPIKTISVSIILASFWAIAAWPSIRKNANGLGRAALLIAVICTSLIYIMLTDDYFWRNGFPFIDINHEYDSQTKNILSYILFGTEIIFVLTSYLKFFFERQKRRDLIIYSTGILFALIPLFYYYYCNTHRYRNTADAFFNAFCAAMAYFIFMSFRLKSLSMKIFIIPFAIISGIIYIVLKDFGQNVPDGVWLIYAGLVIVYSVICYFVCKKLESREHVLEIKTENTDKDSV